MTKEELEKEAVEQANKKYPIPPNWDSINLARYSSYEEGYFDSAEPREKRIEQLEKENAELKDYAIQLKTETAKRDTELTNQLLELDKERIKAKEFLRDVLPYIDLTDCVNSDPRLVLYDKIKSLIKEIEK